MTTAITIVICTACVAVALIVGAVILMEKEQKQYKGEKRVAYLCDKKRTCSALGCRQCEHTTDIEHAKNFKREYDGAFTEIEKSGESEWVYPLTRSRVICWIPVEERLPDNTRHVLVSVNYEKGNNSIRIAYWHNQEWQGAIVGKVIAWAELPEPYKK